MLRYKTQVNLVIEEKKLVHGGTSVHFIPYLFELFMLLNLVWHLLLKGGISFSNWCNYFLLYGLCNGYEFGNFHASKLLQ